MDLLIAYANTTDTTVGAGAWVETLFTHALPALFFLAVLSALFGFIKRLSSRFYSIVLIIMVAGMLVAPAAAVQSVYSVDAPSQGIYNTGITGRVIDVYGNPVACMNLQSSDWLPSGTYFNAPSPGRYYIVQGECTGSLQLVEQPTVDFNVWYGNNYGWWSGASTRTRNVNNYLASYSVDYTSFRNTVYEYKVETTISKTSVPSTNPYWGYLNYWANFTVFTPYNVSVSVSLSENIQTTLATVSKFDIYVNDTLVTQKNDAGSATINIDGHAKISIRVQIKVRYDFSGTHTTTLTVSGPLVGAIGYSVLQATEQPYVSISYKQDTATVYAHNFTITTHGAQAGLFFLVPVDMSELQFLTLNPVVLEGSVIHPARLVELGGRKYIVFKSWSHNNITTYTVIWNYPTIVQQESGIFVDTFTADPLLSWVEQYSAGVTRVLYNSSTTSLIVEGANYTYAIARNVSGSYSAAFAVIDAEYKQLWVGGGGFQIMPLALTDIVFYDSGVLYNVSVSETTSSINMVMEQVRVDANWTQGSNIALVAGGSSAQAVMHGVVAVYDSTEYNVTYNKQLLRLKINVERYSVGRALPQSVGYWTHYVSVSVTYDPSMLPPNADSFQIRILLPERLWVSQGLARPGLADIAVVDAAGNLLEFWVEPYMLPDGSRGVWVKLPAKANTNLVVFNIYLNNTRLEASLSTPTAFKVYYDSAKGAGTSWSITSDGYVVTNDPYINTIVVVPGSGLPTFIVGPTPLDYYKITAGGIAEVHSNYEEQVQSFSGYIVSNTMHILTWTPSGVVKYLQGRSELWSIDGLNKPYTWPPVVVGAANVSFIGLAVTVPYSYSIGTITGGKWDWGVVAEQQAPGQQPQQDWRGLVFPVMLLLGVAIAMRLISNPPQVIVDRRRGVY